MPELPEVETIKKDLAKNIIGHKITGVDFLWPGILKGATVSEFEKTVVGQEITAVERRAKNLYATLLNNYHLLFHMKMTGHLIYTDSCWQVDEAGRWIRQGEKESPMYDPLNQYIRMIFSLSDGKILAFSDLRKFAYVKLLNNEELKTILSEYGPEPFSKEFSVGYLKEIFAKKKLPIKKVLMDQTLIAGIGNIYADEILYASKIHPLKPANELSDEEIKKVHQNSTAILKLAVEKRGTSTSDFRDTSGKKGEFGNFLKVYRRTGQKCSCGDTIKRITVGGRGTHFCPSEQKL